MRKPTRPHPLAAALAVVGLSAGAIALAQSTPPAGNDAQARDVPADPKSPVAAGTLLPLAERSKGVKIIDGEGEGRSLTLAMVPVGDGRFALQAGDLDTLYLEQDEQGAINLTRITIPAEGKGIVYEPPLPLLPATLTPGMKVGLTATAKVYDLKTNEVTRTGTAHHDIERVATATFNTPAGKVRGYLVTINHRINLDLGEVTLVMQAGYHPGEGMVYRRTEFTIEKMGLFGDTTTRTLAVAAGEMGQ